MTHIVDEDEVLGLADSIHDEFDSPFTADSVSLQLGASIGVAMYPDHASTPDLLIQRADAATYTARLAGSGIELYAADTDPYRSEEHTYELQSLMRTSYPVLC